MIGDTIELFRAALGVAMAGARGAAFVATNNSLDALGAPLAVVELLCELLNTQIELRLEFELHLELRTLHWS
jgi:hypothetical protein